MLLSDLTLICSDQLRFISVTCLVYVIFAGQYRRKLAVRPRPGLPAGSFWPAWRVWAPSCKAGPDAGRADPLASSPAAARRRLSAASQSGGCGFGTGDEAASSRDFTLSHYLTLSDNIGDDHDYADDPRTAVSYYLTLADYAMAGDDVSGGIQDPHGDD